MEYQFLYMAVYVALTVSFLFETVVIIARSNNDVGTVNENKFFNYMCVAFCIYLCTETFAAMLVTDYLHPANIVSEGLISLGIWSLAWMSYFWLWYVESAMRSLYVENRKLRLISMTPLIVVLLLLINNVFTHQLFIIMPNGKISIQANYFWLSILIELTLVVPTIHDLYKLFTEKRSRNKALYVRLMFFVLFPLIGGIIESFIQGTPVTSITVMASIFFVFVSTQAERIYTDHLTGIGNRRKLDEDYFFAINNLAKHESLVVAMLDIDNFKQINGQKGHHVGDEALRLVAKTLTTLEQTNHVHIARWGGDEFVIFAKDSYIQDPSDLESMIRFAINKACLDTDLSLSISVGMTQSSDPDVSLSDVLKLADTKMYEQKMMHHRQEIYMN